ncbi:SLBB domain-containing protein [Agathobacter ruminis]|uniref:NADH-quinone oxidoreductase subunit J n=1 Tax=Agathobacter ruminis TaxID=1712665 RepID=A0A2G3E6E6_9FIRM|nr:SLBB domain-containing protein [Agathobacter ruminis]MDC7301709.1 SLBB domain-containing protein [Agathobacter ruminis]PHU38836.1 NADH-quinone oxidoreductase subunit J [Agathobacter ruminis]
MNLSELSEILKQNGIVGAGGAGFPTYGKLSERADIILLNCAECEPLLKLHRQLLCRHASEILKAFALVASVLSAKQAIIGIKEEYTNTIAACEEAMKAYPVISMHKLPGAYPMGDEVVLIYEATGRVVRPGGLPIEQGVCVFNVETLYNIYRAVYENRPVTEKYVTIAGEVQEPQTLRVPIGMSIHDVVQLAGGVTTEDPVYLLGGPMMGNFGNEFGVITKTTSAIIVLPQNHPLVYRKKPNIAIAIRRSASSCCQCRTCTDLCPRHNLGHPIEPHLFMRACSNADTQSVAPYINTLFCSSCNVCEMYACPQGLSPRSIMAEFKNGLRKSGVKPPEVEAKPVSIHREYHRIPEERLVIRLGLRQYDSKAELQETGCACDIAKIRMSQHIGAPAKPVVAVGDSVKAGQMIGEAQSGLSVNIHASISGTVREVTDAEVVIAASKGD